MIQITTRLGHSLRRLSLGVEVAKGEKIPLEYTNKFVFLKDEDNMVLNRKTSLSLLISGYSH